MTHWISIRDFPIDQDLSELAQFIQRYQLPLHITEENNRQVLWVPDSQFREIIEPLIEQWCSGKINLADISVQPLPDAREAPQSPETEAQKEPRPLAFIPDWPWYRSPLCVVLIALCFVGWWLLSESLAQSLIIYPQRSGDPQLESHSLAWHWAQGEYWRLWSPAIVHFSLPHALFNALGIWILGRPLEVRAGTLVFAVLVFVSAPVANLAQYYWSPQILFGGMSGVVYALVGAVLVLQRWLPGWHDVPAGIITLAVAWLLLCAIGLVGYVLGVGIANAAHIGGFFCGLLLALLYCIAGGARHFSRAV